MRSVATAPDSVQPPNLACDAFVDGLRPLLPAAYRLAYGMLQNHHEAEDAVQEATFKAWRARDRLWPDSDLKPWFLTIVANQCRQERRSRWWSVLKQADVSTDGVVDRGASSDDAAELRRLLARLPHDQRLILVLRYYLDFSYEDVAHALRISGPAARSRVHRALNKLRLELPEVLDDE